MEQDAGTVAVTFGPDKLPLDYLDFFEMASDSDVREAMLAVFRSHLGSELQQREPTKREVNWIRETVAQMVSLTAQTEAGTPDDYIVELCDGDEPFFGEVSPSQCSAFGFEDDTWESQAPQRIGIS